MYINTFYSLNNVHVRIACVLTVQVCALEVEVGQVSQERELLSHTLTDRTAQLQLQITQNEVHNNITCIYMYCIYIVCTV